MRAAGLAVIAMACAPPQGSDLRVPSDPPEWSAPTEAPEPPRSIVINEVLAGNDSILRDAAGDLDDWAELYNTSAEPVSLAGWVLESGQVDFPLPADVTLEPGGRLLVWLDAEPEEGPDHGPFRVAADGEHLDLWGPDGSRMDRIALDTVPDDVVWGRFPDGGLNVAASIVATPGEPNPVDPGLSRDPSDALFPPDQVIRIDITLPDASYSALAANRDAMVEASVEFDGMLLDPVQLTIKGGYGSERDIWDKAAFRLNLDTFLPGQRLRGQEHLTLNNMVQDPSCVHETITYELMREAGIPAPRVAHVELWMNGQYRGLYLNVETIDDQFLQRWFDDPWGNVYEGAYGADVTRAAMGSLERDEVGINDVSDLSELIRLADFLAQPPSEALWPEFQALIDERSIKMMAAEVVVQHWDGYFWYPNNYRIAHEPSVDRWTLIPWGTDQTYGFPGGGIHDSDGAIGDMCMGIPSCKAQYDAALWEMADRLLAMDLDTQVDAIYNRVATLYEQDPFRESSPGDMRTEAYATPASARGYANEVKATLGVP